MRHNVFGKQLNRDTGQRQALLKGLAGALIRSEAIETTEAKAKAAVSLIEKLITKAKTASLNDVRQIETVITDKSLIQKLVSDIAPRFKNRAGGYLRLIKLGSRVGDNAPMVRMEFTSAGAPVSSPTPKPAKTPKPSKSPKKSK
jgi:large subunit ribosomal protein L17